MCVGQLRCYHSTDYNTRQRQWRAPMTWHADMRVQGPLNGQACRISCYTCKDARSIQHSRTAAAALLDQLSHASLLTSTSQWCAVAMGTQQHNSTMQLTCLWRIICSTAAACIATVCAGFSARWLPAGFAAAAAACCACILQGSTFARQKQPSQHSQNLCSHVSAAVRPPGCGEDQCTAACSAGSAVGPVVRAACRSP